MARKFIFKLKKVTKIDKSMGTDEFVASLLGNHVKDRSQVGGSSEHVQVQCANAKGDQGSNMESEKWVDMEGKGDINPPPQ